MDNARQVATHVLTTTREGNEADLAALTDSDLLRALAGLAGGVKDRHHEEIAAVRAIIELRTAQRSADLAAALVDETRALQGALAQAAEANRLHAQELELQRSRRNSIAACPGGLP